MSNSILYENNWINLVFENRNKKYGAFRLRKENTRTSIFAFFMGLLLCSFLMGIPRIISFIAPEEQIPVITLDDYDTVIEVTNISPPEKVIEPELPASSMAAKQKPIETIDKQQLKDPIIVPPAQATPDELIEINTTTTDSSVEGTAITGANTSSGQGDGIGTANGTETGLGIGEGNGIVNSAILDKKPEFPGGIGKFYRYVGNNFRTPIINDAKTVRIYVSFVVEKDGSMSDIKVINNPGHGLDKEAIRVLKSIKAKWSPGIIKSKPVRTAYQLPIAVQIN